jgi:hypothetical protein
MRPSRWFPKPLLTDIVVWLCFLGVLALINLATSGALQALLTVPAVFAWVATLGPSAPGDEPRQRKRSAPLLVKLAPAVLALTIAGALASDEWYGFTAIAIAFPLMVVWRHVYWRWQDRRASHGTA